MNNWFRSLDLKVILAFAAVYIIWGTTYLAIKIGLEDFPPFLMAGFRYVVAGLLLAVICVVRRQQLIDNTVWRNILLGAVMLTLGQGVLFWAELYLSSGLTAVLVSTLPIWYIVVDRKNWKGYFNSWLTFAGIALGLAGILLLFKDQLSGGSEDGTMKLIASLTVLGSCLSWAVGSIYYKNHAQAGRLFPDVSWQLLGGAVACLLVSLFADPLASFSFSQVSLRTWAAISYLAVAGSVVAFTASYYLLSVRPPAVVGTYAYVNPIIAVLLGVLVANEHISVSQVLGIAIILVAAYLSNRAKLTKS
ncbi:EamA family transporter [Pedobacter faecalis]|uniref:EamA family transporter n=1 Tax=Pedobacter faecalis TaxID=3041495 RepID=UPI00254FE00F|nr:EamA family transporter [Pedobacter sp. ELA7]